MKIKIKDYDLSAGQARMRASLSRELGLGSDSAETDKIRQLAGPAAVIQYMQFHVLHALEHVPVGEGGLATVGGASAYELTFDLPLVRAALMLAAHPSATPIEHHTFFGNQHFAAGWKNTKHDAGPVLDALLEKHASAWNLRQFEAIVWNAFVAAYGDEACSSEQPLNNFFAGSSISEYARILAASTLFDFFGAFDPAFTRQDALQGEWWLIQPVSPRLDHYQLATNLGFHMAGYLTPADIDDPARIVMACYRNRVAWNKHSFASSIGSSKFCAGHRRVVWSRNTPPLNNPQFTFVEDLLGVTADSYGPYKHASDLPPWGSVADDA